MTIINLYTRDQELFTTERPKVAFGNQNSVLIKVDFDSKWDGYAKSAVFHTEKDPKVYEKVLSSNQCTIPTEIIAQQGFFFIGVRGVNSTGTVKQSMLVRYKAEKGSNGQMVYEPSPGVYQQILSAMGVLESRMNTFAKLPSGSTAGDAELMDMRVGVNGETYDNAGTAVRSQIGAVNNDQRLMGENGQITLAAFAGWKIGGMMSAQPTTHRNRIVSGNILYFDRSVKLKIADGFRIGVHTVTEDGTFVADSNWQQGEYIIPSNTHFKIVVARVTEIADEIANIAEFSAAVTFETFANYKISNLSAMIEHHSDLFDLIAKKKTIELVGAYYTVGGSGLPNNRIHASDIVCDSLAVVTFLDPTKEYFYGVDLYTNDGRRAQISQSGWMRTSERPSFIVTQNCVMDISISKINATSFDDLSEMDGLFTVSIYDTLESVREDAVAAGKRKKSWLTSAHQGFVDSVLRPNSLAAYYNAYLNGADMIETDAWRASDGVFIVNHDPTVTGKNENGETVTYTIAETPSSVICSLILSNDETWGIQKVPTLKQVLDLAYHTGLIVNIDLKNGYSATVPVAKMVLASGMQGNVIYALNGSGMAGINAILAIDPDARFIDGVGFVSAVANFDERGKRCFAFTSDMSEETVNAIRNGGCMLALISLNASNFESAMAHNPDMCEYLHTSNFKAIEDDYFKSIKLY